MINKYLAECTEITSKEAFIAFIKKLYDDANNLNSINYNLLCNSILNLIDWMEYKKERKVINPEFKAID